MSDLGSSINFTKSHSDAPIANTTAGTIENTSEVNNTVNTTSSDVLEQMHIETVLSCESNVERTVDVHYEDMTVDESVVREGENVCEEELCTNVSDLMDEESANEHKHSDHENIEIMQIIENDYFQSSILIELGRRLWKSSVDIQHYTKGCLWSPDGTCILVPVHMDGMHVVELPSDLYTKDIISDRRKVSDLPSAVHVREGGTVYDCVWYPFMNSNAPETCCWLATRQHEPIHMWDAFDGKVRCSYRGYNEVDEVESAISIIFSNDGEKVFAGYKKAIKVFDTNIPGRDCTSVAVKQAISCFALTTDNDNTITCGSWNGYINHYDLRAPKLGPLFTLGGHKGGITWLRYAASVDSWMLYSGARKDNKILQWDMRNYTQPVRTFNRVVATNQRIYFDLSPLQLWLCSGATNGVLHIWDLQDGTTDIAIPLHDDCCNGVSFHPSLPILATSSGQYHFADVINDEDTPLLPKDDNSDVEKIVNYENSLIFTWFGKNSNENT